MEASINIVSHPRNMKNLAYGIVGSGMQIWLRLYHAHQTTISNSHH